MPHKKTSRSPGRSVCGQMGYDDGVDPRHQSRGSARGHRPNYKNHQLCRQVEQILNLVLSGEFQDERLHNLFVDSVRPAPDASQMLVRVQDLSGEPLDPVAIINQLERVSGHLRSRVAAAISRKRAPRFLFQVVAPRISRQADRN